MSGRDITDTTRNYRAGNMIGTIQDLLDQRLVIQVFGPRVKAVPRGWFLSWQLKYALDQIRSGRIYKAVRKEAGDE